MAGKTVWQILIVQYVARVDDLRDIDEHACSSCVCSSCPPAEALLVVRREQHVAHAEEDHTNGCSLECVASETKYVRCPCCNGESDCPMCGKERVLEVKRAISYYLSELEILSK
jgi:hypothetical protein